MASSSRRTLMNLIKQQKETLPPEQDFLLDLKKTVSILNSDKSGSNYYKPSSMNCQRMMYFTRIQAPKDNTPAEYNGTRICETGTDSHLRIQGYVDKMKDCGIDCIYVDVAEYVKEHNLTHLDIIDKKTMETKLFDKRYNLSFLCDGIIKYKGKYYILEIKTETDQKGLNRNEADPKHKKQSVCYSLALGISDIMWLYEERNFCTPKAFHTIVTEEDRQELAKYILNCEKCVETKTPPKKPDTAKYCEYCQYKKVCFDTI